MKKILLFLTFSIILLGCSDINGQSSSTNILSSSTSSNSVTSSTISSVVENNVYSTKVFVDEDVSDDTIFYVNNGFMGWKKLPEFAESLNYHMGEKFALVFDLKTVSSIFECISGEQNVNNYYDESFFESYFILVIFRHIPNFEDKEYSSFKVEGNNIYINSYGSGGYFEAIGKHIDFIQIPLSELPNDFDKTINYDLYVTNIRKSSNN